MGIINSQGSDKKVKISNSDIKSDVLANKLVALAPLVATIINAGGNEQIQIGFAGGGFPDHHSGYRCIENGVTVEVNENKQMTNWGGLKLNGTIVLNGDLILR